MGASWGVQEHKELRGYLSQLCLYDQVDPTSLAAAEAMLRRRQTIEFSYLETVHDLESKNSHSSSRLAQEEQAIFGGMARVDSALMISPPLLDFARSGAKRSASLAKNLRKARGEREACEQK